jgi:cytochrome c5
MQREFRHGAALGVLGLGLSLVACGAGTAANAGDGGEPSVESEPLTSCKVAVTTCTKPAPHYADITGVLDRSCNPCHTGIGKAPWPLTTYDDVSAWADSIQQDLSGCTMPPLDGGIGMSAPERRLVLNWVQCGALQ